MHFDSPFINLSEKENLGDLKRLEQRKVLKKVIEYIKENKIEFLFISGDLYEHKYIKKSTIEYINNLFKEIPETRIFITPGNHDPYLKNSYYNKYKWNENVKIFTSEIEKVELENIDIYGFGFDDFYFKENKISQINIENKSKINILIMHASLDSGAMQDKEYNPVSTKEIKEKGFNYVALGHIHKLDYNNEENQNIVYPGSTISLGFDELGEHGMIVGEVEKEKLELNFIPLNEIEFKLHEIDVTEIISKEELIEKINEIEFEENNLIEIVLVGKRNFEINKYEINKLITNNKVIKIKDKTKINYDLEKISNETTLKGLFAKEMKEKLKKENLKEEERQIIEKAIEIGFEALE
jgi:DNA repair exonuclease SbcCD nuclease subunit